MSEADWKAFKETLNEFAARAEAAERRVAELEARLAEQEWRPVTENPEQDGDYLVWCDGIGIQELMMWSASQKWYSDYDNESHITHWRPLPPPPAATE